ncbi:MAG TPA: ribokinase [Chitinophagaceae bacterium]|nr:ribokinase [Chitinophagaceae bacterium]
MGAISQGLAYAALCRHIVTSDGETCAEARGPTHGGSGLFVLDLLLPVTPKRNCQMNSLSIVVVGSTNTDMVIKASHLPQPGETILGGTFFMSAGGKGANQAVAVARLGGTVSFISKTGYDIFGKQSIELFEKEGIDTTFVVRDKIEPSGVALITVDDKGENCIVVAAGANAALNCTDIDEAKDKIENASLLLMQLEVPIETVEYVATIAKEKGIKLILNPAPAAKLSDELLKKISIITPNQKETEMLTGIKVIDQASAKLAAIVLRDKGIETVIITMGAAGAFLLHQDNYEMIPGHKVKVVDTTAAGDVFNGALGVAICEGKTVRDAVAFACKAAAISVSRLGAQASAPHRSEVESFDMAEARE